MSDKTAEKAMAQPLTKSHCIGKKENLIQSILKCNKKKTPYNE
jgi:hypothetical protein